MLEYFPFTPIKQKSDETRLSELDFHSNWLFHNEPHVVEKTLQRIEFIEEVSRRLYEKNLNEKNPRSLEKVIEDNYLGLPTEFAAFDILGIEHQLEPEFEKIEPKFDIEEPITKNKIEIKQCLYHHQFSYTKSGNRKMANNKFQFDYVVHSVNLSKLETKDAWYVIFPRIIDIEYYLTYLQPSPANWSNDRELNQYEIFPDRKSEKVTDPRYFRKNETITEGRTKWQAKLRMQ